MIQKHKRFTIYNRCFSILHNITIYSCSCTHVAFHAGQSSVTTNFVNFRWNTPCFPGTGTHAPTGTPGSIACSSGSK
jgi:hypothetical protein